MDKTTKSVKISDLINHLQDLKKEMGNLEVITASDSEGNNFGTINPQTSYGEADGMLVIYPSQQFQL